MVLTEFCHSFWIYLSLVSEINAKMMPLIYLNETPKNKINNISDNIMFILQFLFLIQINSNYIKQSIINISTKRK